MRKVMIGLFFLMCFILRSQSSEKAQKLMDKVYEKITNYQTVYIVFEYTLENLIEDINQQTLGELTISGDKYNFKYLGINKIFDGEKVYTIVPENEEVTIEYPENQEEDVITPSKMLTFYREGYSYKWDIVQKLPNKEIQYVELIPIKPNTEIKRILVGVDTSNYHIHTVIQIGKNGTKTIIDVKKMDVNKTYSKETFWFNRNLYIGQNYYIIE